MKFYTVVAQDGLTYVEPFVRSPASSLSVVRASAHHFAHQVASGCRSFWNWC